MCFCYYLDGMTMKVNVLLRQRLQSASSEAVREGTLLIIIVGVGCWGEVSISIVSLATHNFLIPRPHFCPTPHHNH